MLGINDGIVLRLDWLAACGMLHMAEALLNLHPLHVHYVNLYYTSEKLLTRRESGYKR